MGEPLLRVKNLVKNFVIRGGVFSREVERVHAVNEVSFGNIVGLFAGLSVPQSPARPTGGARATTKKYFRRQRGEDVARSIWEHGKCAGTKKRNEFMDIAKMQTTATRLRERAGEIRREAEKSAYPTAGLDAGLLEEAAAQLEQAAAELAAEKA